jgi:sugar phosphate isomerase/epimerase
MLGDDLPTLVKSAPVPVKSCNMMLPGEIKIVGPDADPAAAEAYLNKLFPALGEAGVPIQVFGSGRSRRLPDGFDRGRAHEQVNDFLRLCVPLAEAANVTVVIEPLRRAECNLINTIDDGMAHVRAVDHPSIKCLLDTYHFWSNDEPLASLEAALPDIRHVHVADLEGRSSPGDGGGSDYVPIFSILKHGNYTGGISIEGKMPENAEGWRRTLTFLREAWEKA